MASDVGIDNLPDEVLEQVLSLISPYTDLELCKQVCKRWNNNVQNVVAALQQDLDRAFVDSRVICTQQPASDYGPVITKRYSHSACFHVHSMYIFGGCTSTSTTFNDLWRFGLRERRWIRPLAIGTYPSPKACATMVCYRDSLVLFGGWTHPSPYPLHQPWRLFNQLHIYSIESNEWSVIATPVSPPPIAGHSATIHGDLMVVFGGLQKLNPLGPYGSSNDVWCYDFCHSAWHKQETSAPKPHPRYGQSQIYLDDGHIMVLGGCGGPNMVFSDAWLLILNNSDTWQWKKLIVKNPEWAASHLWCHQACKIGNKVVVLSKSSVSTSPNLTSTQWEMSTQVKRGGNLWVPPREDQIAARVASADDRDVNINGRHGPIRERKDQIPEASSSSHSHPTYTSTRNTTFPSIRPNAMRNRHRQLESLRRMEERIRSLSKAVCVAPNPQPMPRASVNTRNTMALYVMDISTAVHSSYVTWLPLKDSELENGPEETILYTLVCGRAELIMFGGTQKDASALTARSAVVNSVPDVVLNTLYFLHAPRVVR